MMAREVNLFTQIWLFIIIMTCYKSFITFIILFTKTIYFSMVDASHCSMLHFM